ncbi:cytochrome P450 [Fusarium venenatum]|nr:cytochrome P450 [Fusarium venenatum]
MLYLYRTISSPLRKIPGPFLARFSDIWYFLQVKRGDFEKVNIALHEKFGLIVRLGPNRYSLSHMDATQGIYSITSGAKYAKSPWYSAFGNPLISRDLFSESNIQAHAQKRRLYQSAYSLSSMVSYEAFVDECAELFDQRLWEMASDDKTQKVGIDADMGHWFQCYAFDVISMITFSKSLGFLDAGRDIDNMMSTLDSSVKFGSLTGIFPGLYKAMLAVQGVLPQLQFSKFQAISDFATQCMAEHQAVPKAMSTEGDNNEERTDFMTKLMARHHKDPVKYTKLYAWLGCLQNIAAGSDTTGVTLTATLYYLLKYPQAMEKLRQEIDRQDRTNSSKCFSFKQTQDMPYLQAVIKEILRMHPATGLPLERIVPEGGATICDQFFPAGTVVGVNTWVEHYSQLIFGPDATDFRPERWLDQDKNKLAFLNRHWIPFGMGARTCIGRHVSHLEISKLIPRILRDFDFEMQDGITSWNTLNHWFVKPKDFKVKLKIRKL